MLKLKVLRSLSAAFVLTGLTGCNDQGAAPQPQAAASSEPSATAPSSQPAAASDPLSEDALAVQQKLLTASANASGQESQEDAARTQINSHVFAAFSRAADDLKAAGVRFDPAEEALNYLRLGRPDLNVVYRDAGDTFMIVNVYMGEPEVIMHLSGTQDTQTFAPDIPTPLLATDGQIPAGCMIGIQVDANNNVDRRPCRAVMDGDLDAEMTADAKKYITNAMRGAS